MEQEKESYYKLRPTITSQNSGEGNTVTVEARGI